MRTSFLLRFVAMLLVAVAVLLIVNDVRRYPLNSDFEIYTWAASQIAEGRSPYGPIPETDLKYLYSPWLATVLIPATAMPAVVVGGAWQALLAVAAGAAIWPLLRSRRLEGALAAALIGAFLFHSVWIGHVQALMVGLLVLALPSRWGPIAIGVAASLKVTPIVLAVLYAARGEYRRVGAAVIVAAALWAPALLFDVSEYGIGISRTHSLLGYAPVAWLAVAAVALVAAWRLARTRYGWLAAASFWLSLVPNMILYDPGGLAVGALKPPDAEPPSVT